MTTIIAPARRAGQLPLRPQLGGIEDMEQEDNDRGFELDETDTARFVSVDQLLAALARELLPAAGPFCCGQEMTGSGSGCWYCPSCGAALTPLNAAAVGGAR